MKGQKFDLKVDLKDLHISEELRDRTEPLVRNSDLFASKDTEFGHTDTVKTKIDTGNASPIKLRPYRTPLNNRRRIIDETLDEMLESNIIRRSRSPWSFRVVIVDKNDGSKRFYVDFRKLNQVTKKKS